MILTDMIHRDRTDEGGHFNPGTSHDGRHVTEVENDWLTVPELRKKIDAFEEEDTVGNQALIDQARIEICRRERAELVRTHAIK